MSVSKLIWRVVTNKDRKENLKHENILNCILVLASVYISYVFSYFIIKSNTLRILNVDIVEFSFILTVISSFIFSVMKYTNTLFFNTKIEVLISYPIKAKSILLAVLFNYILKEILILLIIYFPIVFFDSLSIVEILVNLCMLIFSLIIINVLVLNLILAICVLMPKRFVSFSLILLQHLARSLLILLM